MIIRQYIVNKYQFFTLLLFDSNLLIQGNHTLNTFIIVKFLGAHTLEVEQVVSIKGTDTLMG